jgi:hypothetical protein
MNYIEGEKIIAVLVEAADGFGADNVKRGAYGILNSGNSDHYAIVHAGGTVRDQETLTAKLNRHRTVVEIWQRLKDDVSSLDSLYEHVANVVNHLDPYRRMGDTADYIRDANITGVGEVKEMWTTKGDAPSWFKQEIYVDWSEADNVTYT